MPDYSGTTGGAGVLLWKTDKVTECKSDGVVIGLESRLFGNDGAVCRYYNGHNNTPIAHFSLDKRPMLNS